MGVVKKDDVMSSEEQCSKKLGQQKVGQVKVQTCERQLRGMSKTHRKNPVG